MTDINEIIGRALLTLPNDDNEKFDEAGIGNSCGFIAGSDTDVCLDGTWDYAAIGAAVVKALGEAGYKIVEDNAGPACTVCGAAAGLACSRRDCGALIK